MARLLIVASIATALIAGVIGAGFWWIYYGSQFTGQTAQDPSEERLLDTYRLVTQTTTEDRPVSFAQALDDFRNIAADASYDPDIRARALNGINFIYTHSNYNARLIKEHIFEDGPFSQYFTPSATSSTDPLHPEEGTDVAAVEQALVRLNELSYSLFPTHYALLRMTVADMFAFQRASVGASTASAKQALIDEYTRRVQGRLEEVAQLGPIETAQGYSAQLRMQLRLIEASATAFVGRHLSEGRQEYLDRGEALFQSAIASADAYSQMAPDVRAVRNEGLLARVYYASYYWSFYKDTDPERVKSVLRPLIAYYEVEPESGVYSRWLPSHAKSTVPPFSVLRDIALEMPELQAFLERLGWVF